MARKSASVVGRCRICGFKTKLSFEHVPPRSAFNDCPIVRKELFELINTDPNRYFDERKDISQRGDGAYTLCERCNNDTGSWYGDAFVKWAHQGMGILKHTQNAEHKQSAASISYTFRIFPLRVIKQIVCMFFSNTKTDAQFSRNHPDSVKFVLKKEECNLNPDIRIYTFFNSGERSRHVSGAFRSRIGPEGLNRNAVEDMTCKANRALVASRLLSEIACRPLGYIMSFDPDPPDIRLVDISFFARYSYYDEASISLKLPVLPVSTYLPVDYRSPETVRHDAE